MTFKSKDDLTEILGTLNSYNLRRVLEREKEEDRERSHEREREIERKRKGETKERERFFEI